MGLQYNNGSQLREPLEIDYISKKFLEKPQGNSGDINKDTRGDWNPWHRQQQQTWNTAQPLPDKYKTSRERPMYFLCFINQYIISCFQQKYDMVC